MADPILRYPDINGIRTSFCSIQFGIESIPIVGVKEINYEESHEIQKIRGTSRKPIGRPAGIVDFTGTLVVYQKEFYGIIIPKLQAIGAAQGISGGGWSLASAPIQIAYAEEQSPDDTVFDTLVGVRIVAPKANHSEGPDALTMNLTMSIMDILWNGVSSLGVASPL
jgi:hypothetical protein